jgi:ribosomal protein S27AE
VLLRGLDLDADLDDDPRMARFDWDDIARRFDALGVSTVCPRCGADRFRVGQPFGLFPLDDDGRPIVDAGQMPYLAVHVSARCGRCGFVALHSLDVDGVLGEGEQG